MFVLQYRDLVEVRELLKVADVSKIEADLSCRSYTNEKNLYPFVVIDGFPRSGNTLFFTYISYIAFITNNVYIMLNIMFLK